MFFLVNLATKKYITIIKNVEVVKIFFLRFLK